MSESTAFLPTSLLILLMPVQKEESSTEGGWAGGLVVLAAAVEGRYSSWLPVTLSCYGQGCYT